jgi:hypothetical protein
VACAAPPPLQAAVLPMMSNAVLVLLKLLLAIVSASSPNGAPQPPATGSGFPPGVSSRALCPCTRTRGAAI